MTMLMQRSRRTSRSGSLRSQIVRAEVSIADRQSLRRRLEGDGGSAEPLEEEDWDGFEPDDDPFEPDDDFGELED